MEVDGDIDLVAHRGAHRREVLRHSCNKGGVLDHTRGTAAGDPGLDGRVALRDLGLDVLRRLLRRGAAGAVGVDPDLIARRSAQELVDRHAVRLACDVPECLLDPGEGAGEDLPASVEGVAVDRLPVVDNTRGILPDQVLLQLLHGHRAGFRTAFENGFPEAHNALVGVDLQKEPAWLDEKRLQLGDFHSAALSLLRESACTSS